MLCDGKCKTERDVSEGKIITKCGLFRELIMENKLTGKTETLEMCVFDAILNSLHRQEQGQVRVQAAIESDRNETANQMEMTRKVMCDNILMNALVGKDIRKSIEQGIDRQESDKLKISQSEVIDCMTSIE